MQQIKEKINEQIYVVNKKDKFQGHNCCLEEVNEVICRKYEAICGKFDICSKQKQKNMQQIKV